jgi:hypothetical protein
MSSTIAKSLWRPDKLLDLRVSLLSSYVKCSTRGFLSDPGRVSHLLLNGRQPAPARASGERREAVYLVRGTTKPPPTSEDVGGGAGAHENPGDPVSGSPGASCQGLEGQATFSDEEDDLPDEDLPDDESLPDEDDEESEEDEDVLAESPEDESLDEPLDEPLAEAPAVEADLPEPRLSVR